MIQPLVAELEGLMKEAVHAFYDAREFRVRLVERAYKELMTDYFGMSDKRRAEHAKAFFDNTAIINKYDRLIREVGGYDDKHRTEGCGAGRKE